MNDIVAIYADGGVVRVNPSPHAGTWAWCHVNARGERTRADSGLILPAEIGRPVSNNVTEFFALLSGLEALPNGWSGQVCSDSQVTLNRFFQGWPTRGIPVTWPAWARVAVARLGDLTPVLLNGHPTKAELVAGIGKRGYPTSEFNVWCDKECTRLAQEYLLTLHRSAAA